MEDTVIYPKTYPCSSHLQHIQIGILFKPLKMLADHLIAQLVLVLWRNNQYIPSVIVCDKMFSKQLHVNYLMLCHDLWNTYISVNTITITEYSNYKPSIFHIKNTQGESQCRWQVHIIQEHMFWRWCSWYFSLEISEINYHDDMHYSTIFCWEPHDTIAMGFVQW